MAEYNVNVSLLDVADVRDFPLGDGKVKRPECLEGVRTATRVILDMPRYNSLEVRTKLAAEVFNIPDYRKLVLACEAARLAFRSVSVKDKDYSYELQLLNDALKS